MSEVFIWWQAPGVPTPLLYSGCSGSQAMSPAAAITGSRPVGCQAGGPAAPPPLEMHVTRPPFAAIPPSLRNFPERTVSATRLPSGDHAGATASALGAVRR